MFWLWMEVGLWGGELAEAISNTAVDYVFIQVGGVALLTSSAIGLLEAKKFGVIDEVPKICAVQTEGCAPFDRAGKGFRCDSVEERVDFAISNAEQLMTQKEESLATGILDDIIRLDWCRKGTSPTGGESIVASEYEIGEAYNLVQALGVNAEPTGSAGVAGVISALESGYLRRSDRVAILLTGVLR